MKHEALTEAISMLDDKLIDEARQPFKRRGAFPAAIKLCGAAAACAAAVGAFLLIPRGGGADILVFGEDPAACPVAVTTCAEIGVTRSSALELAEIPVSVASSEKTVVSISAGELFVAENGEEDVLADAPLEINGGASLIWSVPLTDVGEEYTLTAQTGQNRRVLHLAFDEKTRRWTIRDYSEV